MGDDELGLSAAVAPLLGRAEDIARDDRHRGRYGLVVVRGFGPPAVTAECGAPLLEPGGHLLVSEPPESAGQRWPDDGLHRLGLRWKAVVPSGSATVAVLTQVEAAPLAYPRRVGVPRKRPLF